MHLKKNTEMIRDTHKNFNVLHDDMRPSLPEGYDVAAERCFNKRKRNISKSTEKYSQNTTWFG